MKQLFSKIKTEDLIFDLIIVISIIFIQGIITPDFLKLPAFIFVILAFLSVVSLSYQMGFFFIKYREYKSKRINIFLFIVSLFIFPMIFVFGYIFFELQYAKPFSSDNTVFMIIELTIVIIMVILGMKAQKKEVIYKKVNFTMTIIASLIFSIFENAIFLIVNTEHKQTFKEFIFFVILLIVNGYLPYRLIMAFSPPKNKLNMIIGTSAIFVTIIMLGLKFFQI